ncbi:EF-hand domain-containing protein [Roseateles sp. BYS78W]|uniref:EF-hand domain-containing protein n=1 Tax=Pelomonas candidula TaxID=3299025 RepID=A0ABW7H9N7_9BURK
MITAVNTQALASSVSSGSSTSKAGRPDAEQVFKELDAGNKGYLTVDDLKAAVVKISVEGAKKADAAGKTAPSAEEMLAKMDSDGDGKVTLDEFKAAAPKGPPPGAAQGGGNSIAKSQGGQAQAAAASGGKSGGTASASSTKTYEPADTNQDGKVSAQEQAAYDAKLAAEKAAQAASSGKTAEADAAVKTYESVEQLGKASAAS